LLGVLELARRDKTRRGIQMIGDLSDHLLIDPKQFG